MILWVNHWRGPLLAALVVVTALSCWTAAGVTSATKSDTGVDLAIGTREAHAGQDVSVPVTMQTNGETPSQILVAIQFDSTQLTCLKVEDGPAALAASKSVALLRPSSGVLKLLVWGPTDDTVGNGILCWVKFRVSELAAQGTLPLVNYVTSASPSAATPDGDKIAVSVTDGAVEVGCSDAPAVPTSLLGSFEPQTGVTLMWEKVDGASGYRVYRATTDELSSATAVSDWLDSSTNLFVDASILENVTDYCLVYYWVRARNADECIGDASDSTELVINPIPDAPTGLTASQDESVGVILSWDDTSDTTEYRVYRSLSSDPATRQPLTGWISVGSHTDTTAAPARYGIAAGCSGEDVLDVVIYNYWVTTRSATGCESEPSESAEGFRGLASSKALASVLPSGSGDVFLWLTAGVFLALFRMVRKRRTA